MANESPCYKCGHVAFNPACDRYQRVVNTVKLDCAAWSEPLYLSDGGSDPEDVKRLMESPSGTAEDFKALHLNAELPRGERVLDADIELTCRALKACGYRVHIKERAGSQWVTAVKGLGVRYEHWHPLTNINQAMQLLQDAPEHLTLSVGCRGVHIIHGARSFPITVNTDSAQDLINAQCRAIVTACASLEVVR